MKDFWKGFSKAANNQVFVYRNIRKGKDSYVYSVKKDGKVIGHETHMSVLNPRWMVSEKGNSRVRAEGVKNVHAGIKGERAAVNEKDFNWIPVTYDPKKHKSFVDRVSGKKIEKSDAAKLTPDGVMAGFKK